MRRTSTIALAGGLGALLLAACGGAAGGPTRPAAPDPAGGATADETARAYLAAWEREDAAALAALFTPDARALWALGGGMSKRLQDKRRAYGSPIPGQGRVLAVEEHGGTGAADVGVVYDCAACAHYTLPDWPPPDRAASADRLTLARQGDGRWLITYIEGSSYLGARVQATRDVVRAASATAAAVSRAATETARPTLTRAPSRTPRPARTPTPAAADPESGAGVDLRPERRPELTYLAWRPARNEPLARALAAASARFAARVGRPATAALLPLGSAAPPCELHISQSRTVPAGQVWVGADLASPAPPAAAAPPARRAAVSRRGGRAR